MLSHVDCCARITVLKQLQCDDVFTQKKSLVVRLMLLGLNVVPIVVRGLDLRYESCFGTC